MSRICGQSRILGVTDDHSSFGFVVLSMRRDITAAAYLYRQERTFGDTKDDSKFCVCQAAGRNMSECIFEDTIDNSEILRFHMKQAENMMERIAGKNEYSKAPKMIPKFCFCRSSRSKHAGAHLLTRTHLWGHHRSLRNFAFADAASRTHAGAHSRDEWIFGDTKGHLKCAFARAAETCWSALWAKMHRCGHQKSLQSFGLRLQQSETCGAFTYKNAPFRIIDVTSSILQAKC